MQNAILNEKRLAEAQAGWAAPTPPSPGGQVWAPPSTTPGAPAAPITDGPVTTWRGAMTVSGTISKTSILFVLLLIAAVAGWRAVPEPEVDPLTNTITYGFPTFPVIFSNPLLSLPLPFPYNSTVTSTETAMSLTAGGIVDYALTKHLRVGVDARYMHAFLYEPMKAARVTARGQWMF